MKSSSPKSFFAFSLVVLLSLVAFRGGHAFSAAPQAPPPPPEQTPAPGVPEASGEQPPPFFPDIEPPQSRGERVRVGSSQQVGPDETVGNLVTVFGSAEMAGKTEREMVTVFGRSKMTGEVGREMVTVFGNAEMSGRVNREMVTVFGDAEINGRVDDEVVVIFGSLKLGPNAVLNGDCRVVFGKINRDAGAVLNRDAVEILPWLSGLKDYIVTGPLLGRLLPPGSALAWIVVAFHFVLYFLVAVILPKPAAAGIRQLDDNPLLCFGVGLLTMILIAPLSFILIATGIGILLLPFIGLAEAAFIVLGKVSTLEFFGLQILRRFRSDAENRTLSAFLAGFLLVTVLYMIPILGLLAWIVLRPLALGTAVLSVFRSGRKNGNGKSNSGTPVRSTPEKTAASGIPPAPPAVPPVAHEALPSPDASGRGGTIPADASSPSTPRTESSGTTGPE